MSDDKKGVRVRIEGRVQGVWYRGWTVRAAGRLGLDGWVQNQDGGSVEAVFVGPAAKVDAMIERCRRGPPAAAVTAVHQTPFDDEVASGFHQR
ncbi:MAG: acylphosphatase [Geminicoccaceae bacterium]